MKLCLIVAMTDDGVIGHNNQLPWHLPEDLKRFKQITMGHPIIMGRKTFESIGKALPGRRNIVISRQLNYQQSGIEVVSSLDAALAACPPADEVFIIGGAEIFRQALPLVQTIYLTRIHHNFYGDTRLELNLTGFIQVAATTHQQTQPPVYTYTYETWVRQP